MDYFFLDAMSNALNSILTGGRIRGIVQVTDRSLGLHISSSRPDVMLLMETAGRCPGLFLCESTSCPSIPESPLARSFKNRLLGARILSVKVDGFDRDVLIETELSEWRAPRSIHFEIRGATGNICCVDDATGVILDCLTKIPSHRNPASPRIPGTVFAVQKSPVHASVLIDRNEGEQECWNRLSSQTFSDWRDFLNRHLPCTPTIAQHVHSCLLRGDQSGFFKVFRLIRNGLESKQYNPSLTQGDRKLELHAIDLGFDPLRTEYHSSPIDAANAWRSKLAVPSEFDRDRERLLGSMSRQLRKTEKNLDALKKDQDKLEDADQLRYRAELLTIHYHRFTSRVFTLDLPDHYHPGETISTSIDPHTPLNIQIDRLFKRAAKIKRSGPIIANRIAELLQEIELLRSYILRINSAATNDDLEEVREVMEQYGIMLADGSTHLRPAGRIEGAAFLTFKSVDGWTVYAGRNARENDLLTFKRARPNDFWMHAKGYHGAHVLILNETRRKTCPDRTAEFAAKVAVYYSSARGEKAIPVMLTTKNLVRRAPGGVPGRVIISRHHTIVVDSPEKTTLTAASV